MYAHDHVYVHVCIHTNIDVFASNVLKPKTHKDRGTRSSTLYFSNDVMGCIALVGVAELLPETAAGGRTKRARAPAQDVNWETLASEDGDSDASVE